MAEEAKTLSEEDEDEAADAPVASYVAQVGFDLYVDGEQHRYEAGETVAHEIPEWLVEQGIVTEQDEVG